jgi:hypothetical protein
VNWNGQIITIGEELKNQRHYEIEFAIYDKTRKQHCHHENSEQPQDEEDDEEEEDDNNNINKEFE